MSSSEGHGIGIPPEVPPEVFPNIPVDKIHPSVGNTATFYKAQPDGGFLELFATVCDDGFGGITLQVVNEKNEIEWHPNPPQGTGDGQWQ